MSVTLKDVAKMANVTPTVVSRVLHDKASTVRVSSATAERVRGAAASLGYRVNVMARNFRDRQTKTIGVLNGQGLTRPLFARGPRYFASLMDGIVDGAFKCGYSVTLCPQLLGEHPELALSDGRFDGLIWYSIEPSQQILDALSQCSVPIVIVHGHAKDFCNRYATVIANNAQGVKLAVQHLVDQGHRKIAFALEPEALNVESLERLHSYRVEMDAHGLVAEESDVLEIDRERKAMHAYLTKGELAHTAVIVHADGLAAEFICAAQKYGYNVPNDLAVVGFDSTDFCNEISPSLTSISQPLFDIGASAASQLMKLINGDPLDSLELLLPCGLDIRGSTVSPSRLLL
jgi:LacI family transcriptional regulator